MINFYCPQAHPLLLSFEYGVKNSAYVPYIQYKSEVNSAAFICGTVWKRFLFTLQSQHNWFIKDGCIIKTFEYVWLYGEFERNTSVRLLVTSENEMYIDLRT